MIGSIQKRDAFLDKLAERLGRPKRISGVALPFWKHSPQDTVLKDASQDQLLEVLTKQCEQIHTDLLLTNKKDLGHTINKVVEAFGGGPIVTWKDLRFEEYGLLPLFKQEWPANDIDVYEWDYSQGEENVHKAEQANIGIAISEITLAESGTVVLFSSKDRGRSISFLPATSIMIVPKSSIVPRMTQAAQLIRSKVERGETIPSCINFITGPSNSADIEMNLVVGVHGPVKVAYIVVEDL
ncbi:lactate utilization protein C [Bacillus sp. 03113]|uniref:LutC/YkgG family protein n=1 Tax=Bacillus sp. 03113 TaxID=2578211 RepID=UPI00114225DF|nr:lactate utilization protein C [Bacillus sp. 03113]